MESNDGKTITRLYTNSTKYRTQGGLRIGQSFNDILKSGEQIGVNIDEGLMSIRLYGEGISIQIDTVSEKQFYNSAHHDINDIPATAKIIEFGIF